MKHGHNSLPPSWFVQTARTGYKQWCNVSVCSGCRLRAKYEDMHPCSPCPRCGSKCEQMVGRWAVSRLEPVIIFGFLTPFTRNVWDWEILNEH